MDIVDGCGANTGYSVVESNVDMSRDNRSQKERAEADQQENWREQVPNRQPLCSPHYILAVATLNIQGCEHTVHCKEQRGDWSECQVSIRTLN